MRRPASVGCSQRGKRIMRIKETKLYKLSELSEEAKDKALESHWDVNVFDDWHEHVIEDAKTCGALLGIEIERVYFSGFSSQGDGACFTGSYRYKANSVAAIIEHAPQDTELARIARELMRVQRPTFYTTTASVKHRGHYYHENCTAIDYDAERGTLDVDALKDALRDYMRWVYAQLECEYEYQTSREQVIESIEANEYEFTEDGGRG